MIFVFLYFVVNFNPGKMEAGMTFTIGKHCKTNVLFIPMVDPDLEIRWGAGQSPKNFFRPFRPQFGLQNKGGLGPQPLPWIRPLKFITNRD